jgi:tetratricopeptide (TPR) repeat protein
VPRVPFPPADDPTATLPPSPALFSRSTPAPPPPVVQAPVPAAPPPPPEPPPPSLPPDPARAAREAAEHLSAGRFEDALAAIDRFLGVDPRNGEALGTRARALFKLGRREEAAREIVKAIEASPDSLPSWHGKMVMEHEEGKAKQACRSAMDLVEISQHTLTESPLVEEARRMIAAFEATGAFPTARGYLGWLGIGCASMKAGRAEDALELFDRTIDAASGKAHGFRWKGRALTQLGQMDEALALLDTALEIAPDDPEIHHDRGMAFLILGDTDRAREAFDAALAIDPHHAASLKEKQELGGPTT